MQDIINFISTHQEVLALLPAGLILSMFQAKLTKWFKLQSSRVKQFFTVVITALATIIPAMLQWIPTDQGTAILGAYGTTLFTIMTLSYRYVVKPGQQVLLDAKETRANRVAMSAPTVQPTDPAHIRPLDIPPAQNTNTADF